MNLKSILKERNLRERTSGHVHKLYMHSTDTQLISEI